MMQTFVYVLKKFALFLHGVFLQCDKIEPKLIQTEQQYMYIAQVSRIKQLFWLAWTQYRFTILFIFM